VASSRDTISGDRIAEGVLKALASKNETAFFCWSEATDSKTLSPSP